MQPGWICLFYLCQSHISKLIFDVFASSVLPSTNMVSGLTDRYKYHQDHCSCSRISNWRHTCKYLLLTSLLAMVYQWRWVTGVKIRGCSDCRSTMKISCKSDVVWNRFRHPNNLYCHLCTLPLICIFCCGNLLSPWGFIVVVHECRYHRNQCLPLFSCYRIIRVRM